MNHSSVTDQYRSIGVTQYYSEFSERYENPHEHFVVKCLESSFKKEWLSVLDLACGNGLVSKWIKINQNSTKIVGCDKFMAERYKKETGFDCYDFTFEEIACGVKSLNEKFDVIICSYAIDLLDDSYINTLAWQLATIAKNLVFIRPNNHVLNVNGCWKLENMFKHGKSRASVYRNISGL